MRNPDSIRQKKSLGQVFLKEDWPCHKIVEFLKRHSITRVLEIGPGNGALTKELLDAGIDVFAVEKDERFAERMVQLSENYKDKDATLEVENINILRIDLEEWINKNPQNIAVCGNIPYNISSQILQWVLPHLPKLKVVVFLVQLEFAERLASKPSNKSYGSLSVFSQLRAQVQLEFQVPRTAFQPVPRVDSAVVSLAPLKNPTEKSLLELVEKITRQAFTQRRKKLSNSLSIFLKKHSLQDIGVDLNRRCDSLSPQEFIDIAKIIAKAEEDES